MASRRIPVIVAVLHVNFAMASTGELPLSFGVAMVSLFILMPAFALFAMGRILFLWHKDRLHGIWALGIFAAVLFGMLDILVLFSLEHLSFVDNNWLRIYASMIPVAGVWLASLWSVKRDKASV